MMPYQFGALHAVVVENSGSPRVISNMGVTLSNVGDALMLFGWDMK
jgi:hypothetical protein